MKRAHLCAVAFGRRMFRGTKEPDDADFDGVIDMTPARFDILYLVHGPWPRSMRWMAGSMPMATLRRMLGLSRATISKAVKRLVELGLLTSERLDGRSKRLRLTTEGTARIRRALHLVLTGRALARHFRGFVADAIGRPRRRLAAQIDSAIDDAWWLLRVASQHFGDTSEVIYLSRRCSLEL